MEENKNQKSESALREEKVLEFWEQNQIFQKSMQSREGEKEFVFYEGPPTANGKPGIHHLEARAFKDVIPRYKTMRGFYVRRKGGWDTHGLPVELQVEKKLGLNSKKAIEEYGIAKFNRECKESVWEYLEFWNTFTKRIGYWVDQENPYVTYENNYIESLWNVVGKIDEQKLIYKDYKVVPWCPRCGTTLSSHELAQGYEDVKDLSLYVKFKLKNKNNIPVGSLSEPAGSALTLGSSACERPEQENIFVNTFILAWTTTPWTLPGNVALAVGKDIDYVKVKKGEEFFILAEARISILGEGFEIIEKFKGSELIGLEYEPLFPYLESTISESEKPKLEKAFKVYGADFVTTEDGTGVVHTAVMYGADDFDLGTEIGLPKHHVVNLEGKFIQGMDFLSGRFVKEKDESGKPTLDVDIIKYLQEKNLFFHKELYEHSYPHCWRCKTALIYYARDSWYIRMTDKNIKDRMIEENKTINWEPLHTREGRFGEWLAGIKDWAISRERYWGTPLPIWVSEDKETLVVDSIATLKKYTKKSNNKYFVMRHGQTENNTKNIVSTKIDSGSHITEHGKEATRVSAESLKDKNIDLIISSPYYRTLETSKIIATVLNLKEEDILTDARIGEMQVLSYEGKNWDDYHKDYPKILENFDKKNEGDESYKDVQTRVMDFLFDIENKYQNKNILFVTHGGPAWLMYSGSENLSLPETLELINSKKDFHYLANSEFSTLDFVPFPHDENFALDLHRPYVDEVVLERDGKEYHRIKDVMDVWFDSGAMPFAQDHYPFENKERIEGVGYPADYISEAIDQTRGWFYTLHAVGTLMGRGKAYKNVICLGHLLDAKGKKMSKSQGNIVEPFSMIEKYGVDTLRLWMYSVNQPGESKNFDEKTVAILHSQVFGLLYNVLAFYELYRDRDLEKNEFTQSTNILDQWILAKLGELVELSTLELDNYKVLEPARALRDFIGDLSTWYLRRNRDRIKDGDMEAKQTLYFVLKNLVKIMAPFTPFASEDIWLKLKNDADLESVHLVEWPTGQVLGSSVEVIEKMQIVRDLVSTGLQMRQKNNLPVRQPLASFTVTNKDLNAEFLEIIKDELNVKAILFGEEINLDINITSELKEEGLYREFLRSVQDSRKKEGLIPSDTVTLFIETDSIGENIVKKFEDDFKKVAGIREISFASNDGIEVKVGELVFKIRIQK